MSVAGISSASTYLQAPQSTGTTSAGNNRRAEDAAASELITDLKQNNLAGAQQAYQTLASFGANGSGPWAAGSQQQAEFQQLGQEPFVRKHARRQERRNHPGQEPDFQRSAVRPGRSPVRQCGSLQPGDAELPGRLLGHFRFQSARPRSSRWRSHAPDRPGSQRYGVTALIVIPARGSAHGKKSWAELNLKSRSITLTLLAGN